VRPYKDNCGNLPNKQLHRLTEHNKMAMAGSEANSCRYNFRPDRSGQLTATGSGGRRGACAVSLQCFAQRKSVADIEYYTTCYVWPYNNNNSAILLSQ